MGVEVSLNKTHVSKDTYEFAKRWIKPFSKTEITGIPLKGVINNFENPFIVFSILYDYFKIKKNLYLSRYSLVMLLQRLYYKFPIKTYKRVKGKLKVNQKFLNLSRRKLVMVKALSLSLDIDFNYYTYDKLRSLFCMLVTNDLYPIPGDQVALLEYKRILSQGMAGIVGKINQSVISNPDLLLNKFEVEDKNLLKNNTMFIAVYNTIRRSWETVQAWDLSDSVVLHNASKEIQDLNIDSIFNKDRNLVRSLVTVGSIVKDGFNTLNSTDEIYYGSSTTESTFTANNDIIKSLQLNFKMNLLNSVREGKWQAPRTEDDYTRNYLAAWENFKLD